MNVFIIGNGFDLAHKMLTSYDDFHTYLNDKFPNMDSDFMFVPTPVTAPDGEEYVGEENAAALLCYLMDDASNDNWSDFEEALGRLDLLLCFEDLEEQYDKDGDRDFWREGYNNEARASDLSFVFRAIKDLFEEWIASVEPAEIKSFAFLNMIDPENDLFITFNYTDTLESIYGCNNVVHMHGKIGEDLIVGHNGSLDYSEKNTSLPNGCFNTLQEIYERMRKSTEEVLENHYDEIKPITNCSNIYSIGFSYSSVDLPYIKTICRLINNDIVWHLNDFGGPKIVNGFKAAIKQCGFTGEFSTFRI